MVKIVYARAVIVPIGRINSRSFSNEETFSYCNHRHSHVPASGRSPRPERPGRNGSAGTGGCTRTASSTSSRSASTRRFAGPDLACPRGHTDHDREQADHHEEEARLRHEPQGDRPLDREWYRALALSQPGAEGISAIRSIREVSASRAPFRQNAPKSASARGAGIPAFARAAAWSAPAAPRPPPGSCRGRGTARGQPLPAQSVSRG